MNKRINELAEQAFNEYESVYKYGANIPREFTEKFAELIVKKCADIVEDAVNHREPASTYVDKIKKHFGVEE